MLARTTISAFVGLVISSGVARADFLPPNDLWKEDGLLRASGITEAEFNKVIDEAVAVYAPLISAEHAGKLKVNRLWTDSTVNASAIQTGSTWTVNMYGGLARRPEVTRDGFALVLCHELGHHLGGYPYSSAWAANEGQADYFATLSCARVLWGDELAKNAEARETIAAFPKALCDKAWNETAEQDLCYRTMNGGKSLADLLSALGGTKSDWQTPDGKVVKTTNNAHPEGQCRLDTYMAGAICTKTFDEKVIPGLDLGSKRNGKEGEMDSVKATCNQSEKFTFGYRPLCWFKPFLTAAKS
ncbi:MAG: hypothetical protein NTX25_22180 [Proteobacteria bacterium]|nr:hypothetical protein [Pseudomonadota bacterium]